MTRTSPIYEILCPWTVLEECGLAEDYNWAEMSEQLFAELMGWTE